MLRIQSRFVKHLVRYNTAKVTPNQTEAKKPEPETPKTEAPKQEFVRLTEEQIQRRIRSPEGLKIAMNPKSPDYAKFDKETGEYLFRLTEADLNIPPARRQNPTFREVFEVVLSVCFASFLFMWAFIPGTQTNTVDPAIDWFKMKLGLKEKPTGESNE